MNHWAFIIAAYGLTALGTAGVLLWSYLDMRRAEKALADLETRK
jgi:heme exporter protein CcmD